MSGAADPLPNGERKPFAVVDVGSNSVRLVVFEGRIRCPAPIFNERELCGLGRNLAATGRLDDEAVSSALGAIQRFVSLSRAMGAGDPEIVATAAVREAENGMALAEEVKRRTGVGVHILDGREEARLSCLGVTSAIPMAEGLMGDLGGGSLEIVGLEQGGIGEGITLPLGPLRLLAEGEKSGPAYAARVDETIQRAAWMQQAQGQTFYAVGGAWRGLAKIHQAQTNYPLQIVHHYDLPRSEVEDFANVIARLSHDSLDRLIGINAKRRPYLPLASLVLARILNFVRPERVVFSAGGLREGLVFDNLDEAESQLDPLIAASRDFARMEGRFDEHGQELFEWMAPLFPGESRAEARLRLAACALGDTAWRAHPDYRALQAFGRILFAPFTGINHRERAVLALAVHARYAGHNEGDTAAPARSLVDEFDLERATVIGLALRLGHVLSGGTMGIVGRSRLNLENGPLVLTLPNEDAGLIGASVAKRLTMLGEALGRAVRLESAE